VSYDAMRWAMRQKAGKGTAKLVLLVMADCVNGEAGEMLCWPSQAHLARVTELDIKTVELAQKILRDLGLIVDTEQRRGETGRVRVYRLNTTESGGVSSGPQGTSGGVEPHLNTAESGGIEAKGNPPVFPCKTPVFPGQDPQISHETPPKTGDGTSNGTRKRTSKEPGKGRARARHSRGLG
jgi:hypothetical protein